MKKNEIYNSTITGISTDGSGVCKIDGIAVFVPSTAIGDKIQCKIVKVLNNYAFGICMKILSPSKDRENSQCPVFNKCGGCVFRHINYSAEGDIKHQRVSDAISRIGGYTDFPLEEIGLGENRNRYRNKAQIPLGINKDGEFVMGFYSKHSHRIVEMEDCLLQPQEFTIVMNILKKWQNKFQVSVYNEETHTGLLRHLYLRIGEISNELMVCLVINGENLPYSEDFCKMLEKELNCLSSVILNINTKDTNVILGEKGVSIWGKEYITDTLCGLTFNISPLSFFQVNRSQAEKLYEKAKEYANLKGGEVLLDLYCGTGTIGLSMAENAKKLVGVEIIPQAIENAKINALNNNIKKAHFICGDATVAQNYFKDTTEKPNVVLLDPPRKGCQKELIEMVSNMTPEKIVYISCDPATLARDLKIFTEYGYILKKAKAFDLFPSTSHVETVCLITKELNKK